MKSVVTILFLVLFLVSIPAEALDFSQSCEVLFETFGRSDVAAGQRRFEAAVDLKENGTGAVLPDNGRRLDIPSEDVRGLSKAFQADYEDAATKPNASPAAKGNLGHMQDHKDFVGAHGDDLHIALGVDLPSLILAVSAHDIGKGHLDAALAAYVKARGEQAVAEGQKGVIPFLHNFILSHEEHSIARVPEIVVKYLTEKYPQFDPKSPEGRALVLKYSAQIIEVIRQHNGVDVTGDLTEKFPSLTSEEIEAVRKAWWPANYEAYAKAMKLPKTQYGGDTNPIGETLNFIDRATLTTKSAPIKLMLQRLGNSEWGIDVVREATVTAAEGNVPLIKAQGDKLKKLLASGDDKAATALNRVINAAQKQNHDMIDLGKMIGRMNDPVILKVAGVTVDKGTIAYQRKNGEWVRINGKDKANGFVEVYDGLTGKFTAEQNEGGVSPATLLMRELARDGRW